MGYVVCGVRDSGVLTEGCVTSSLVNTQRCISRARTNLSPEL